jgi:hypothetical protein
MKDAEEHKFTRIGRRDLLFLSNANAFREQGGAIFADWEALSRREVWAEKMLRIWRREYATNIFV